MQPQALASFRMPMTGACVKQSRWMKRSVHLLRLVILAAVTATLAACASRPSGVLIAEPVSAPGATKVDMLVATTRKPSPVPGVLFSGERDERGEPSFTAITVSIPPDSARKVGEIQWPSRMPANPATDFTTTRVEALSVPKGVRAWAENIISRNRHVLVFVHGFNTQYDEAVYRFAQIVHDSKAKVTPVLFTWPSRASVLQYPYDKESTNYSRTALEDMLWRIAQEPSVGEVSIVAHSMGTWLTVEALRQMAIRHKKIAPKIKTVMLASADLDIDVFAQQMKDMGSQRPQFVIFVSRDDRALDLSRMISGDVDRLGQIDPTKEPYRSALARVKGVTIVDLSGLQAGDDLNHNKFAQSPEVAQLIGQRLAGQSFTPQTGLGGRIGAATAGTIQTLGSATGAAINAPIAIFDSTGRQ